MKKESREEINKIIEEMVYSFESLMACKNRLEEIGGKAYAKKLDTITGKLDNLIMALNDKTRN